MRFRFPPLAHVLMGTVAFGLQAHAQSSFVINLAQVGSDVVATGSGTIDTSGLTSEQGFGGALPLISPVDGAILAGPASRTESIYQGFSGPSSFGSGSITFATTGTGDSLGLSSFENELALPGGYESGTALSDSATWTGTTLSDLEVTPGTYTWTWATHGDSTFTLNVGTAVPEPSAYGWLVVLGVVTLVARNRFRAGNA